MTLLIVNKVIDVRINKINLQMISIDFKFLIKFTGNMILQLSCHIFNLGFQHQFLTQMKVSDTAQSISFVMKGDINSLKYLFSQGLTSPRDMSNF